MKLYFTQHIEDRKGKDGKIIQGAWKVGGQYMCQRRMARDIVDKVGDRVALNVP